MMFSASFVKALPLLLVALAGVVAAADPEVVASAAFPETNLLSQIFNGQRNTMQVAIENKSALNITLKAAAGSIHDSETGKLIKNLTAMAYGLTLPAGQKTMLPYTFYSESKPRDVTLKVWVDYIDKATKAAYVAPAHDSVVSIVEPPSSWFDLQLLYTYTVILALLGGVGYLVYGNVFEAPKTKKGPKPQVSAPVAATPATPSGTNEEEWIPAHHLKTKKAGGKSDGAASSSGDETGPVKRKSKGKRA